jgi:uncharacterized protein (UPF0332 family)
MSFDWTHYYTLADALSEKPNDESSGNKEAAYRSAVSRAYYAALHTGKHFLVNKYHLDAESDLAYLHEAVPKALEKRGHSRIGKNLQRLKKERRKADYEDHIYGNIKSFVKKNLTISRKIIEELKDG